VDVEGIKNHSSPKGEQLPAFEAFLTKDTPNGMHSGVAQTAVPAGKASVHVSLT
jgi:hypothetical protein